MNLIKKYRYLTLIIVTVFLTGCGGAKSIELTTGGIIETGQTSRSETEVRMFVYVSGCVKKPGVYCVDEGARLYHVIEMAGGMTGKARKDYLDLAETVHDGQSIRILSKSQYKKRCNESDRNEATEAENSDQGASVSKININTADERQLQTLPGIGNSKAQAILKYRNETGEFSSIEDIKKVSGIGEATYSNIESLITVN